MKKEYILYDPWEIIHPLYYEFYLWKFSSLYFNLGSPWSLPNVVLKYKKKPQEQQEDCKMTNKQYAEEIDTRGNKRVVWLTV